jgi:hypothetical protein
VTLSATNSGGTGNAILTITIAAPVPTLTSLSPASAAAGAGPGTVTLHGTNFLSTSTVTYKGVVHAATWVNSSQSTISLSAADQAVAGTYPVVVTNPGPGGGISNSVNFTVSSAVVSLSPSSLTFASQTVGATSAAQTLTLNNTGNSALSVTSIALVGANPSDFAQTNNCGSSVAAGANCTISVTFTATASGTRTAALALTDNATGSPQSVTLTGTGTNAATTVSFSPTSDNFGNQAVGAIGANQPVQLYNTGNSALTISSLALTGTNPGDFAQSNNCGSSVAVGGQCTINVTFKPTASGTRTAALTFTDNATGSPQAVTLTGTGTSSGPTASLSPASLIFASQAVGATSAAQTVTLNNTGNSALSITSIALAGTNPGDFAQTNNCGSSVAAGANCTISVTFTAAASGTRTAALALTDNATGSPQSVSLSGTAGSTGAVASLSPSSLTFGNGPVAVTSSSQVVTLTNTGTAALSITSIAFTGANASDFSQISTCGASVAAGGTCTIAILFTPAATGSRTASLTVADNASGSPQAAALSGAGTHDVILSWSDSTTSGISGYNVYRGTASGGQSSTPLNSMPVNGITFVDTGVTAGARYYYVVTAVASSDGAESAKSNETSATVPTP